MSPIEESDRGNMLDFPKIRAFIWLQTKNKFGRHIIKFQIFEAFQMVDARGHLLQTKNESRLFQFEAFQEEAGHLHLLSTYSILPNFEALET